MPDEKKTEPQAPLFVVHPDDLQTEEQKEALADHVADEQERVPAGSPEGGQFAGGGGVLTNQQVSGPNIRRTA